MKKILPYAYFKEQIVPIEKAQISIASHSLQYGTTCFGGIRGYLDNTNNNTALTFRLPDHFKRLINAAKILGMEFKIKENDFLKIIEDLIKKNKPESDFYIRPFIFTDDQVLTPKFHGLNFTLGIYMIPLGDYLDTSRGLKLMVSTWRKFSDASMSTKAKAGGSYIHSSLARSEAERLGYDEALVMDEHWNIVEGSAENLFIIYRGEAIIPQIGSSMLEGITLRTAIELLEEMGIKIRYEKIDRSMIYTCDELILTGTGAQILFAHSVDDRVIGEDDGKMGPICKILREKFNNLIRGTHPKSKHWITTFKF